MKHYYDEDDLFEEGEPLYVHDCPFCGSKQTDLYQVQVQCERCDAHGPRVDEANWPMAIKLWNDLPRKHGGELLKLRRHWSNLMRRIKRAEARYAVAREKERRNSPEAKQSRADKRWAREREKWLHAPIEETQGNG